MVCMLVIFSILLSELFNSSRFSLFATAKINTQKSASKKLTSIKTGFGFIKNSMLEIPIMTIDLNKTLYLKVAIIEKE